MIAALPLRVTGTLLAREYALLKAGAERVARTTAGFDRSLYPPRAIERAGHLWSDRMVNEYTSTSVFSQLAAQLMEANAPLDATAVTLRMAQDELRHAEICSEVCRALGAPTPRVRETGVVAIARHPGCSDEERALRNVVFTTCLSEMNSVAYFVTVLEGMTDPYLRDVTRSLLADEVLHGRFGFLYLESRAEGISPEMGRSIANYLRFAFAVVEREFAAGENAGFEPVGEEREACAALGVVPREVAGASFRETMEKAVVPGLERFGIPAEDAWRRRALG